MAAAVMTGRNRRPALGVGGGSPGPVHVAVRTRFGFARDCRRGTRGMRAILTGDGNAG